MLYGTYHQTGTFIARCLHGVNQSLSGRRPRPGVHVHRVLGGPISGIIVACWHGEERTVSDGHTAHARGAALLAKETV
jgi:hypothetical protein